MESFHRKEVGYIHLRVISGSSSCCLDTVSKCGCVSRIWNESRHVQCRDELFVGPDGLAYTYVFNEARKIFLSLVDNV